MSDAHLERPGEPKPGGEDRGSTESKAPEGLNQEYVRGEVQRMIESDWSNEELRSIGITRELAAELGIRHPRFGHFS